LYLEINAKPQSKYTEKIGIKNKKIIKIYLWVVLGIHRLRSNGLYTSYFPLHEVSSLNRYLCLIFFLIALWIIEK
jgi:hypothetical protein